MKKFKMIPWLLSFFLILGFGGVALGGGAEGGAGSDCACVANADPVPLAKKGPFVRGTFTVSRDPLAFGDPQFDHYTVHLVVRKGGTVKLYRFITGAPGPEDLCDYTAEDLLDLFAALPCQLDIDKDFGFEDPSPLTNTTTPLFKSLRITHQDNCTDPEDWMIRGTFRIGFVPFIEECD